MKTFRYLLFALLAAFVSAGCTDDLTYTPGEGDQPGTYGVYFPTQANATALDLDPADPTTKTYTIKRTNSKDEITVPVVVEATPENVFEVSEIKFAEGQTETEFTVKFDEAEIGVTYTANISVKDKAYAAVNGLYPTGLGISVIRTQWNQVLGPNGETTGKWRDEFFTGIMGRNIKENGEPNAEKDVVIWERADKPGYYRIKDIYDADYMRKIVGTSYSNVPSVPTYTIIDATDKNKVWLPCQTTGFEINGIGYDDDGKFVMVSFCEENFPSVASANKYGTIKDGILTFPDGAVLLSLPSIWEATSFYLKNSNITRLIMPGYTVKDYSIALAKGEPADGVVEIGVEFGPDAKKMKYTYFEGTLTDGVASLYANDMNDGKIDFDGEITAAGTIRAQMNQTGVYTIVGCGYDAEGNMKSYAFLPFGYIKAGEEKPVVMNVRTELTWEKEALGHTPENSIKGILFGQEIESGYYALTKTASVAGAAEAQLTAAVKAGGKAFSAEQIEKINGEGYAPFFTNLEKGTSYTLLVWVYNGYYGKLFAVEQTTQGDPDPREITYTLDDMTEAITKDELLKTWNLWAADLDDAKTDPRVKMGQVVIAENTEADTDGFDAISVTGLSAGLSTDDTIIWQYDAENGVIWVPMGQPMGQYKSYYLKYACGDHATKAGADSIDDMLVGVKVGEGLFALVCSPAFSNDYNFDSIFINAFSDPERTQKLGYLQWLYNILLEDPAVAQTASVSQARAAAARLHALSTEAWEVPSNYVELRGRERLKAVLLQNADKLRNCGADALEGEVSVRKATPLRSEFSEGRPAAQTAADGGMIRSRIQFSSVLK